MESETKNMIVFKRCGKNLVYLQKILGIATIATITNENRKSLKGASKEQKLHAKYRANKLLVLKIEHLWKKEKKKDDKIPIPISINEIKNTIFSEKQLTYKVGEIIEELEFDKNLEKIYGQGIHYYLDKDTAKFCMDSPLIKKGKFSGEVINYHENGNLWSKCMYIQGKENGEYKMWYENGNLFKKCTYIQGKKDGEYEERYKNGNLLKKCIYIQGYEDGEHETWYENDIPWEKCTYIQGKLDGKYEEWNENGSICEKCTYIQGELDGKYERWNEDGNICKDITYSKGEVILIEMF